MDKKAFTLIELLVVIAIIGTIAAFLVPTLGRARESARTAQCVNNLRQIGMAMHMYIDEHDFRFPPIRDGEVGQPSVDDNWWFHYLEFYIDNREVFNCPSYKYHDYEYRKDGVPTHFSYGYNYLGLNLVIGDWQGQDINWVRSPSQCIMVADGAPLADPSESYCWVFQNFISNTRHSGGTNILFIDGHVSWTRYSDIPMSGDEAKLWWNF